MSSFVRFFGNGAVLAFMKACAGGSSPPTTQTTVNVLAVLGSNGGQISSRETSLAHLPFASLRGGRNSVIPNAF